MLFVLKEIRLQSRHLKRWSTPQRVSGSWINFPSRDYLVSEPFGSILMISPWNYPFQLALTPLVGAVAAGNTVVLKPSESAPKTGAIVAQIIEEAFPKEWVTVVEGGPAVAQELLEFSWDYIFYTGSTTVGKLIAQVAAKNLTPTTLELGGKSPCIVEDSAPLKSTAKRIVWGKFLNCGQTCIAPDYVLVSPHKKEALMTALKKEIIHAFGENPAKSKDYGRIINEIHIRRLKENLKNQNVFYGGYFEEKQRYAEPTIVDSPSLDSQLMTEEIFGPIASVIKVKNYDEALNIANDTEFGLSAGIVTNSLKHATHFKRHSQSGIAQVNLPTAGVDYHVPFGGTKSSSYGAREQGQYAKEFYTTVKTSYTAS